jgi:hypothetical protein
MRKVLLGACLALGLLLVPVSSSAATVQNVIEPLNASFFNPCTGDTIAFSGTFHFVIGETADGSGGFHMHIDHNVSDVTGVGAPSGSVYHAVGAGSMDVNVQPPFPAESTTTFVINFISVGGTPNFVGNEMTHFTINANGTTTAQVMRISFTCK